MTAREKFKKGDRVKLTEYARLMGLCPKKSGVSLTGVVVGFSTGDSENIIVIKDGNKTRESWSMDFWEVVQ